MNRIPSRFVSASIALIVVIAAVMLTWTLVTRADANGDPATLRTPGSSRPLDPNALLAGRVIRLITTSYTNYEVEPRSSLPEAIKAAYGRTVTTSYIEFDGAGAIARYRTTARTPEGRVIQDLWNDGDGETVNWYGWQDTAQNCSEQVDIRRTGGALTTATAAGLAAMGYTEVPVDTGTRALLAAGARPRMFSRPEPAIASFPGARQVTVLDEATGFAVGRYTYGVHLDGTETLLESELVQLTITDEDGLPELPRDELPPCSRPPRV